MLNHTIQQEVRLVASLALQSHHFNLIYKALCRKWSSIPSYFVVLVFDIEHLTLVYFILFCDGNFKDF